MRYRFRRSVYGTKKFYSDLKQGQMSEYWKNPTAGYGELMKMDPQLEYESKVYFLFFTFKRVSLFSSPHTHTHTQNGQ